MNIPLQCSNTYLSPVQLTIGCTWTWFADSIPALLGFSWHSATPIFSHILKIRLHKIMFLNSGFLLCGCEGWPPTRALQLLHNQSTTSWEPRLVDMSQVILDIHCVIAMTRTLPAYVLTHHVHWEHAWSSGKGQDSWSLDHQCCEFEPRYGQSVCVPGQDT